MVTVNNLVQLDLINTMSRCKFEANIKPRALNLCPCAFSVRFYFYLLINT